MSPRIKYDEVKQYVESFGCHLITEKDDYKGILYDVLIRCVCGDLFTTTFDAFRRSKFHKCKHCSLILSGIQKRKPMEQILEIFHAAGYSVIDGIQQYTDNQSRFTVKCPEGHVYTTDWVNFNSGFRCPICAGNVKYTYDAVKQYFDSKGAVLLSDTYTNCKQPLEYICACGSHNVTTFDNFRTNADDLEECHCINCRRNNRGSEHYNYKGGITEIRLHLRQVTLPWIYDSLRATDYKCYISGVKGNLNVHHYKKSFADIVKEVMTESNLPIHKDISSYSDDELRYIDRLCLEKHYAYGLGMPMDECIHVLFHTLYGSCNNTEEQIIEFINRYHTNEFAQRLA
jgi:hypothetical protein